MIMMTTRAPHPHDPTMSLQNLSESQYSNINVTTEEWELGGDQDACNSFNSKEFYKGGH